AGGLVETHGAFHHYGPAGKFQASQAQQPGEDAAVVARLSLQKFGGHIPQPRLVEATLRLAQSEQAACGCCCGLGYFHDGVGEKFWEIYASTLASASSLMRRWSSALRTLPVTCDVVEATRRPNSR